MGIKYLNRFIHSHPASLLEDVDVRDSAIIVDGAELMYHLYFVDRELDIRSGGEYAALRQNTNEFIDALSLCGIKCYVVFDSFKSESNITRYRKTRSEKLTAIRQLIDHGSATGKRPITGGRPKPLLGKEVLMQTLFELGVPFVVIPGDADAELAAIANSLDAAVLAGDTDFCVFSLNRGFLPIEDFKWREVLEHRLSSCKGKIFRRDVIERTFGTPARSIAFLAPLMSHQDGIEEVDFTDFFKSLGREMRVPPHLRGRDRSNFRRPNWIECVLLWLNKNYNSDEQTIDLISRRVSNVPEDLVREMLHVYNVLPDVEKYTTLLQGGGHDPNANLSCFEETADLSIPAVFLPIVPDDQEQPSSHTIAVAIRNAIYQVGFVKKNASEGTNKVQGLRVLEIDRDGHDYKPKVISVDLNEEAMQPIFVHLESSETAERNDHSEIMEARRNFLLEAVLQSEDHTGLDSLGEENRLVAATLKYWALGQGERQPDEVVKALAFSISAIHNNMETYALPNGVPDNVFDKEALHFSTQWQACVIEAMRLNTLLGCPLASPRMGNLFSGRLFQRAYYFLANNDGLSGGDQRVAMFDVGNEDAADFFDRIMNIASA